ncbi:MAG TPA: LysR family transcriptional regulator [Woeseiaceae bacterium]|nr:LysR family transcriptional regulator [Woeseiaceae bacterium]
MDRLFCMRVFVRVVEHGAFVRAADALGVSRTTVTDAVGQLEKRLGVRLLHRTTRKLSVTDEGRSYYASCIRILDEIEESEDDLSGVQLQPRGRLRVSVPQSFFNTIFYPGLTAFMRRYSQLEVEVVLTDRAVNLVEEGIDCAIRGLEIPADSTLVARKLSPGHWLTCASPEYVRQHGMPHELDELSGHNCIRLISPSSGRPRDWQFCVGDKIVTLVPGGNLRLTSFDAAIQMAAVGAGVAQVPDGLAHAAVMEGRLLPLLSHYVAAGPPLILVYPGNRYVTAKVRVFNDFFEELFPKEGWWSDIAGVAAKLKSAALVDGAA